MTPLKSPWRDPAVADALLDVKLAEHLVLLVGAGTSMPRGLPSWAGLTKALVSRCAMSLPAVHAQDRERLGELLARESGDPMAIVDFLEALLGERWVQNELSTVFYSNRRISEPSDLLNAVTYLIIQRRQLGLKTTVITTNFDDLLESEIDTFNRGKARSQQLLFQPTFDRKSHRAALRDRTSQPIYHVHGFIGRDGRRSKHLILSLSDFARDWQNDWSHGVFAEADKADVWLTVGMGLSDLHVLRYLKARAQRQRKTYALLPRQSHAFVVEQGRVGFYLERAVTQGFRNLGVNPVFVNWFGELAQFFDEVTNQSGYMPNKRFLALPYNERLERWWNEIGIYSFYSDDEKYFNRQQREFRSLLIDIRSAISAELFSRFGVREEFKVEFWASPPTGSHELELVASSEVLQGHGSSRASAALHPGSRWALVRAYQEGIVRASESDSPTSRWRSFSAWPVRVESHPYGGILVGVMVFASRAEIGSSALTENEHISTALLQAVITFEKRLRRPVAFRP